MAQVYQPSDYCFTALEIGATFEWFTNNGVFYIKLKAFYLIIMLWRYPIQKKNCTLVRLIAQFCKVLCSIWRVQGIDFSKTVYNLAERKVCSHVYHQGNIALTLSVNTELS